MQELEIRIKDFVDAQLYANEDAVLQDAIQHLLQDRPDLRVALAIHRYQTDPDLSLARAAELAGVSFVRMKDLLVSHGVPLRLGPASGEDVRSEVAALNHWLDAHTD